MIALIRKRRVISKLKATDLGVNYQQCTAGAEGSELYYAIVTLRNDSDVEVGSVSLIMNESEAERLIDLLNAAIRDRHETRQANPNKEPKQ